MVCAVGEFELLMSAASFDTYLGATEFGLPTTTDERQVVRRPHHLDQTDAGIEVYNIVSRFSLCKVIRKEVQTSGCLEQARLGVED